MYGYYFCEKVAVREKWNFSTKKVVQNLKHCLNYKIFDFTQTKIGGE